MTEFLFLPADRWEKLVGQLQAENAVLKAKVSPQPMKLMDAAKHYHNEIRRVNKQDRYFNILLQLAYEFESLLGLFENESSQERLKQVSNILRRMEEDGVTTSTEAEPQPANTKKEGPKPVHQQDYWTDN